MEFRRRSQNVLQCEVKDREEGRRDPRGRGLCSGHQKETLMSNWTAAAAQHILKCFEWLLKLSVGKSRLPSLFGVIAGVLVTLVNLSSYLYVYWGLRREIFKLKVRCVLRCLTYTYSKQCFIAMSAAINLNQTTSRQTHGHMRIYPVREAFMARNIDV